MNMMRVTWRHIFIALFLFWVLLVAGIYKANAQTTKSNIVSDINGLFADNVQQLITAAFLRTVTTEIVSSYVDYITCTNAGGLIYYLSNGNQTCLRLGTAGQILQAGGVSPTWQNAVSMLISGTGISIGGTVTPIISLSNQIVGAGPIGSATTVPSITFNSQGQLTTVTSNTISASTLLDVIGAAQGDILFRSGTGWAVLTPGVSGQVVATQGAGNNIAYINASGAGTVQSVTCGGGTVCNPSPISVSGVISLAASFTPQARITLTSGSAIMTATVSNATNVFVTPFNGNIIPIFDGTNFAAIPFSEVSQATTDSSKSPAAVFANSVYDIFCWIDNGTNRCTRGPAWTSTTVRSAGTSLTKVQGLWLNQSSIVSGPAAQRGTYIGTIASNSISAIDFIYGSSAAGGGAASFGVWNAYNRIDLATDVNDSNASWTDVVPTWNALDQLGAGSGLNNRVTVLTGLAEDSIIATISAKMSIAGGVSGHLGISQDNISSGPVYPCTSSENNSTTFTTAVSTCNLIPNIGVRFFQAVQNADGPTATYFGALLEGLTFRGRY